MSGEVDTFAQYGWEGIAGPAKHTCMTAGLLEAILVLQYVLLSGLVGNHAGLFVNLIWVFQTFREATVTLLDIGQKMMMRRTLFLFSPKAKLGILCWVSKVEMESSKDHFSWTTQNGDLGISAMSFYFYQDFTCATLDQPGTLTMRGWATATVHCKPIFMAVQPALFHALGQKLPGFCLDKVLSKSSVI